MTIRNLARISATGLLAAGALAAAATPALAAEIDFGVNLKGTTIALGTSEKPATVSVANNGAAKPETVGILFDVRQLNDKVSLNLGDPDDPDSCKVENGVATCEVPADLIPGPNQTADLDIPLKVADKAARGSAGKLTVTVVVDGDTVKSNNSTSAEVVLSEKSGVDLRVLADDVTVAGTDGNLTGKPLEPGQHSYSLGYIANHGDTPATNLEFTTKLPKDVTFAGKEEGCEYNSAMTTATCEGGEFVLLPDSYVRFALEVVVSAKAKGPATLGGGLLTAAGKPVLAAKKARAANVSELPSFAKVVTKEQIAEFDVDASDNADGFVALLGGPATGGGGGDSDSDDPSLPVTGPVAASAAGAGVLALGVGAFLFISARRRRISFAAPSDNE
jgi:hypothetical protein